MIVSASRRTDIPAFYGRWFRNRLDAGFCLVPNPFNPHQISRVSLDREDVDAFVFWTRDPRPFAPVLRELDLRGFPYVVLFTVTGYGEPLEPGGPAVTEAVAAMHQLAGRVGPDRVVWRYDPIVIGPGLDERDHRRRFADLAGQLCGATTTVTTSLVDLYGKTRRGLASVDGRYLVDPASRAGVRDLMRGLAEVAGAAGMGLQTCAEPVDWSDVGAPPGACIDPARLARLVGRPLSTRTDPGQRRHCRCAPSRDIGMNDSCPRGCVYCYATRGRGQALRRDAAHDPTAESLLPLLENPLEK